MPRWLDTPAEALTLILIATSVVGVLMWVINAKINEVIHETQPNSGESLRDAVDRIELSVTKLNDKLDSHIQWHLDKE
jgi:hypothetical protein